MSYVFQLVNEKQQKAPLYEGESNPVEGQSSSRSSCYVVESHVCKVLLSVWSMSRVIGKVVKCEYVTSQLLHGQGSSYAVNSIQRRDKVRVRG